MKKEFIRFTYSSRLRLLIRILLLSFAVSCSSDVMDGLVNDAGLQPQTGPASLTVVSAEALSNTTVKVTFSQDIDLVASENPSNYSITSGLSVLGALRDGAVFSEVVLTTDSQNNVSYTITASGITDTLGNPLETPNTGTFTGDALPYLVSATANTNTSVLLQFSEAVEPVSAQTLANYLIPGLTINGAARNLSDYSVVELTTSTQSNVSYTLTVSGITDITGNTIGTPNTDAFIGYTYPSLLSASATNNTTVELHFSEAVEQISSETEGNYSISGLGVSLALRDAVDFTIVRLTTSTQSDAGYTVIVSGVTSALGVPLGTPDSAAFTGDARPNLVSATSTGTTSVDLQFSEAVELASAETDANYSIPGLTVTLASRDAGDNSIVHLITSTYDENNYTVTVNNVKDATNNTIGTPNSASFAADALPVLMSVSSAGNTTVYIYFSEAVDPATANTSTNYVISPAIGVVSAARDATNLSKVVITTASQGSGTLYSIAVSSVEDLTGNPITSPSTGYFTGTGMIDTTAPSVLSAVRIDGTTVEIVFSESVDLASSQTMGNYTILDSTQNSIGITGALQQADTSRVRLTIGSSLTDHLYTVTVSTNVKDLNNNSLQGPPMNSASFAGSGTVPQNFTDGPVAVDPMNEGANPYGLLIKYRNRIYLGPSTNDNAMLRLKADGSNPEMVTLRFHGPSSITTTLDPGPDAEDGIDYFTGGTISGVEYLFLGPSKSNGDLNYLYYTTDSGSIINFYYTDVSAVLDANTRGTSSMALFNNRLYAGFPGTGGKRPHFMKLQNVLQSPVVDTDLFELEGDNIPRIGDGNSASPVGIDAMGIFGDMLYIANGGNGSQDQDGGIVKSTINDPRDYVGYPDDWQDITPAANPAWYNSPTISRFSIALTDPPNKITPAYRAFPSMAVFNGKLYAIRNTTGGNGGPQIWKYDGASWTLVAGSAGISDMGNSNNSSITLLVTNGDRLYVGYDNWTNGITVYRTRTGITDPSAVADFEQVATSGLGDSNGNKTIFSALSASYGGIDYLWILCGKSTADQRLYRTMN